MISSSRKAKILWQCRRGMLELDLMLAAFTKKHLEALNEKEFSVFESLLETPDPLLYAWLIGSAFPEDKEFQAIVALIRGQYQAE